MVVIFVYCFKYSLVLVIYETISCKEQAGMTGLQWQQAGMRDGKKPSPVRELWCERCEWLQWKNFGVRDVNGSSERSLVWEMWMGISSEQLWYEKWEWTISEQALIRVMGLKPSPVRSNFSVKLIDSTRCVVCTRMCWNYFLWQNFCHSHTQKLYINWCLLRNKP